MRKVHIFSVLIFLFSINLFSQSILHILDYDQSGYPLIKSKIIITDNSGNFIYQNSKADFLIRDNGLTITNILNMQHNPVNLVPKLSMVLAFDRALSTENAKLSNFQIGIDLVKNIINLSDLKNSEIALTSYDILNYMNSEFSQNSSNLLLEVDKWTAVKGSKFDVAFWDEPAGLIKIAKPGKNKKVAILVTDGSGNFNKDEIVAKSKESNISFIILVMGKKAPIKLKMLSNETNSLILDNIDSKTNLNALAGLIINFAKGDQITEVTWQGDFSCLDTHAIEITVPGKLAKGEFTFTSLNGQKPMIVSDPVNLGFSSVNVGAAKTMSISIIAQNADILIDSISLDAPFKITTPPIKNKLLKKDDFVNIDIEYKPDNPELVFTQVRVTSNACETQPIYITGGFPNIKPKNKTIKLVTPKGGDFLFSGDTTTISWIGLLPKDIIQLSYKTENDPDWKILAKNIPGLDFKWNIPKIESESCKIGILQLWPNNLGNTTTLNHNNGVNSAYFNKNSDLVITASDDSTAVVWISLSGDKKFPSIKHNSKVIMADFDPMDRFFATLTNDSIYIWDLQTAVLNTVLYGTKTKFNSINFSEDGNYICSCDDNGNVFVWDVKTWELKKKFDANNNINKNVYYAKFHPLNSDIIASANYGGLVKTWNWKNYISNETPLQAFDSKTLVVHHVTFNTDGTKIAASTQSNRPMRVYVWDTNNSKDTIYTISHLDSLSNETPIRASSFFFHPKFNKEIILTSGNDFTARSWDAINGSPQPIKLLQPNNIFKEHSGALTRASFDKYGSKVLTSSLDGTAKIWDLLKDTLQSDTTKPFSIVSPKLKISNINFGNVMVGNLKDSTVSVVITNPSKFAFDIYSLRITGFNADEFSINDDITFPRKIFPNDTIKYEMRFEPKAAGFRSANIECEIPMSRVSDTLSGNGIDPGLFVRYNLYDYGIIDVGNSKDSLISAIVTNKSNNKINLKSIKKSGSYEMDFSILSGDDAKELAPGQDLPVAIRFSPELVGRKNAQFVIDHDGLASPTIINLFGEGSIATDDTLTIYTKDIEGEPGQIVKLPIFIKNISANGFKSTIQGFYTYLTFNTTLLEPISEFEQSSINGFYRTIKLKIPSKFGTDSLLTNFDFRIGLGNDTISPMKLEFTSPYGLGKVFIKEESSKFTLKGYCIQGSPRLFDPTNKIFLNQASPNPAFEKISITFSIAESGTTKLSIIDMLGRVIKTVINSNLAPGNYSLDVNLIDIPSGIYYYTLETPSDKLIRILEVEK